MLRCVQLGLLFSVVASFVLGGCVTTGPSVAAFYVGKSVEAEPAFVGVWELIDQEGKPTMPATFTMSESREQGYNVHVSMKEELPDGERVPNMHATIFRVGQSRYINLTLGLDEAETISKSYGPFILTTHYLIKAEFSQDEVKLLGRQPEINVFGFGENKKPPAKQYEFPSVDLLEGHEELLKEGDKRAMATTGFQARVITASSRDLQRAIVEADAAGQFKDVIMRLRRVKHDADGQQPAAESPAKP
ncbi:MAG TPA: hypothetical protein VK157_16850 [Phycisphaerales bacterium]|nr:hypothetical protein [Phycisphaerales bacterium]